MSTQSLTLETAARSVTGKRVHVLRRSGITPLHLYGKDTLSLAIQADAAQLQRLVAQAGKNIPVSISVQGTKETHLTFIREVQRHPITEEILHVDFYKVPASETTRAEVPVYLTGEAPAVRTNHGVMLQALHHIQVESLPLNIPQYIEVDVSDLDDFEKAIYVHDLKVDDSVTFITTPDELVARVNPPRVVVEEEVAAVAEAAEVTADAAEEVKTQPSTEG